MNDNKVEVNGLLAELAYLKLESSWFDGINKDGSIRSINNPDDIKNFISEGKEISDIDPSHQQLMLDILKDYEIVDFKSDDGALSSDFQGMLLKEKSTGERHSI